MTRPRATLAARRSPASVGVVGRGRLAGTLAAALREAGERTRELAGRRVAA